MSGHQLAGSLLLAGLVIFTIGAAAWRLEYERPLADALRVIHGDRGRRAWIHLWMIVAMFVTPAGLAGVPFLVDAPVARVAAAAAAAVYAIGAVCWIASLAFRLTVVPWAAERTTVDDTVPAGFPALDAWAGSLYLVHMVSAYAAFAVLGVAVLDASGLPTWLGLLGVGWGVSFALGIVSRRLAVAFQPPLWAHTYTAVVGAVLLTT